MEEGTSMETHAISYVTLANGQHVPLTEELMREAGLHVIGPRPEA